jgi:cation diffusion facilitator CzcD-associated flavoprotein CzcO
VNAAAGKVAPDLEVAVIGSGFAGLGMAISLERQGRSDYAVFERADSLGGTWRDNHYPGCACDVPTPLYSFSFAPNPDWSYLYARHDEIRAYLEDCADRFGVRDRIEFGNGVATASWDDDSGLWTLRLDDGSSRTARVLVAGIGGLNRPALPDIEGLEDFAGPLMHSAAWDHSVDLTGKRVAVIGTGASAIQIVPEVAKVAGRLDVFQRTAPWVLPRIDFRMRRWMKSLFRHVPLTQKALRGIIWGIQESVAVPLTINPALTKPLEAAGRRNIARGVEDEALRKRLTPSYKVGCKRILVSNDYYPAFSRDNVELVTDPIVRITEGGIETAAGELREVDVIVCATGFDIREALEQADVRGRGGVALSHAWAERIEAHRGTMIRGFPNVFMLSGPNTGTGNMSQVFMIEAQIGFVDKALEMMRSKGADRIEVTAEAQRAFNDELVERMGGTVWVTGGCKSWYLTEAGHSGVLWPGFSTVFRRELSRVDESEYEFGPSRPPEPAALESRACASSPRSSSP